MNKAAENSGRQIAVPTAAKEKFAALLQALARMQRVAVAFSAGVDSSLLLFAAKEALGENAVAVHARSAFVPQKEQAETEAFCAALGVRLLTVDVDALAIPGVRENPVDRCYLCKRALFGAMLRAAREAGCSALLEGSNTDDLGDYRPGLRALRELQIGSPLLDAGLTKAEIRALAKEKGLACWDKPAMACLATRFPVNEKLTEDALRRVEQAEDVLRELGFRQLRVRVHGDLARIELGKGEVPRMLSGDTAAKAAARLRALGFRYVTLDLQGYRTGSMNAGEGESFRNAVFGQQATGNRQ